MRKQMLEDGDLSELDLKFGGPVPSQPVFDVDDKAVVETAQQFWDDISGEELPVPLVTAARKEEIDWVRSIRLYDKVPRSEMVWLLGVTRPLQCAGWMLTKVAGRRTRCAVDWLGER